MKITYILTTFSPAMFGNGATAHVRMISKDEAQTLVTGETRIVATRSSHEQLAKASFPAVALQTQRYANLHPGVNALAIHYRGTPIPDSGKIPIDGVVTLFLIETVDYQQAKAA